MGAHALADIISIYDDAIHLDTPLSLSTYSDEATETVTLNVYKEDTSLQVSDTFTYTLQPDCELVDHIIYTPAKSFDSYSVAVNGAAAQFKKTFDQHTSIYPVGCPLSYTIQRSDNTPDSQLDFIHNKMAIDSSGLSLIHI